MAIDYHKKPKHKLTMRQAARVSAETTIRTIAQAFDQVRDTKKRVIDPIDSEILVSVEYLQNHKKSPFVTEEECKDIDQLLLEVGEVSELFTELGKVANKKAVEIDGVLTRASVHTNKVLDLVRNGVPKDGTHESYKDELLFLEVEHTTIVEEAIELLNGLLNAVSTATTAWSSLSKKVSKYSNLDSAA